MVRQLLPVAALACTLICAVDGCTFGARPAPAPSPTPSATAAPTRTTTNSPNSASTTVRTTTTRTDVSVILADVSTVPELSSPVDVKFHTADGDQLWIANRGKNQALVLRKPGTSQMSRHVWQDRAEYHYNGRISALSFDNLGKTMITCQNIKNDYYGMHEPNYFMGPTIYEVFPVGDLYGRPGDPVATRTSDYRTCDQNKPGFPDCYLVHSDMLHEAPMCMGTVHDPGAVTTGGFHSSTTESGHVYFYSDGIRGELMRFDAESLHGPGSLDHRTANIRRYIDINLKAVDDVPGHMVLDNTTRILYVADPGNGRVLRIDADGGEFKRVAQCVPDECYRAHEGYNASFCTGAYCSGGPCLSTDGYGCYNTFTEMADVFEYELWECSTQDDFITDVPLPSGLVLGNGRLYVGDYASGNIHVYDLSGTKLEVLPLSQAGLAGLEFKCVSLTVCNIYFANALTNTIAMATVDNVISSVASKPLPRRSCNVAGNFTRPKFDVMHGPGYQSAMVIKYSYGKHCDGFEPGEDVEEKGMSVLDVFNCPDRTDCAALNGDAILMAGYLCHPCIPNPCASQQKSCLDLIPYCVWGFECTSDLAKAQERPFCMKKMSPVHPSSNQVIIADQNNAPALLNPVDVKFHPKTVPPQLWIANRGRNHTLVLHEPGTPRMSSIVWQDRAEYHYTGRVSALSFDNLGETVVTCQNIKNDYNGMHSPNYFMGPTIYEIYPVGDLYGRPGDAVASRTPDGRKCDKAGFPDCYLIHSDMLHESPMCMGTVHDPGAVTTGGLHVGSTRSGHVYFYSDGLHGELMRFDAETLHGPGSLDHRTANIRRYVDIKLKPVDDVPGHMVLDNDTRILYVADPGNSRVLRVHADGGEFKRVAQCIPDECYSSHEGYKAGNCDGPYCTGGRCLDTDGYGCYHTFTETADTFEYELWNCSTQDDFVKNIVLPSGLALGNGRLYVGDYASGSIHIYDMSGQELGHLPVSQYGLAGLEIVCIDSTTCNLYFANALTNEIGMVSIANERSTVAPKPLPHRSCNIAGNFSRPGFLVSHGPGYQNPMSIKYSYGKHCGNMEPGEDVEVTANKSLLEMYACPDRTDCAAVNGDAILMAGYLCHPCIPNPCKHKLQQCVNVLPYSCRQGFQCTSDLATAQNAAFCDPYATTTSTTTTAAPEKLLAAVRFEVDDTGVATMLSSEGQEAIAAALEAQFALPIVLLGACLSKETINGRCPNSRPHRRLTGSRRLDIASIHIDFYIHIAQATNAVQVVQAFAQVANLATSTSSTATQLAQMTQNEFGQRGIPIPAVTVVQAPQPANPIIAATYATSTTSSATSPGAGAPSSSRQKAHAGLSAVLLISACTRWVDHIF